MLARKYYAQRGTSKGPMNTNAVTQSSSTRAKRLRFWRPPVAKNTTPPSASDKIQQDKKDALRCGTLDVSNPRYSSNAVCNVAKDQKGRVSSSQHTENVVASEIANKKC